MSDTSSGWTSERVLAIARLAVMLVAMVAGGFGLSVDADSLYTVVVCIIAVVAAVWSWWKNNSITKAAQQAQHYLEAIRGTSDGDTEES